MVIFIIAIIIYQHLLNTLFLRSTPTPASPLWGGHGAGATSPPPSDTWSPPWASATEASIPARWTQRQLYLILASYWSIVINVSFWLADDNCLSVHVSGWQQSGTRGTCRAQCECPARAQGHAAETPGLLSKFNSSFNSCDHLQVIRKEF